MENLSAFDIIGPAMVGPSSSHTAGAVRIGLAAFHLFGGIPATVRVELHGSFAATGKGHATDRALVAGLLGWNSDDERLKTSLESAEAAGMQVHFAEVDLGEDAHPNSVRLTLSKANSDVCKIIGASLGGGVIDIRRVDEFETNFSGSLPTLAVWHADRPGFLSKLTTVLACAEVNIATIRTSRKHRAEDAFTVVETDGMIPEDCRSVIARITSVHRLRQLPRLTD